MLKPARWLVLLVFSVAVGFALAARNSSGSYSLPSGNPVIPGTSITSSWANNTLADLATETTNSLDRNGRGAMLAPLKLADGTSTAPGLAFSSEPSSGLYRAALNDLRLMVGSTQVCRMQPATFTINVATTETSSLTVQGGATVTQSTTNAAGVTSTGNGSGEGGNFTGGAGGPGVRATAQGTAASGVLAQGAGSGYGVAASGGTSGAGGLFTSGGSGAAGVIGNGGSSGPGVLGTGGGSNPGVQGTGGATGVGIQGTGGGTTAGGSFANGTAATTGTPQDALVLTNGYLGLSGVAIPASSTTGLTERVTPKNIVKAWGYVVVNGSTHTASVSDGFNLSGTVTLNSTQVVISFASSISGTRLAVVGMPDSSASVTQISGAAGSITATFQLWGPTGVAINPATEPSTFGINFVVFGS